MQIDRPIAIAITLFIILLLVFFLVVPEYNTFNQLQTQLGEKTAEYNAEFAYYSAISNTYQDLQSNQDNIKIIDDALPQTSNLGSTIYYLQETAKENGLIMKNLFLSQASASNYGAITSSNVKDIVFSMDVSGNYTSLGGFLLALENSSRIFDVSTISFGSSTNGSSTSGSVLQDFSLQIKTHSY